MEFIDLQTQSSIVSTNRNNTSNDFTTFSSGNSSKDSLSDSALDTAQDQESSISDCESVVDSGTSSYKPKISSDGLVTLFEGNRVHDLIKQRFLSCLGLLGPQTNVVAIQRNSFSSLVGQARLRSFQIYLKALEEKCAGNPNVKYAWYAPSSKDEVSNIISHGFGHSGSPQKFGSYGSGIYLAPDHSPLECIESANVDEDGLRHLLLCRVILGRPEVVLPGSQQCHPSSQEFDSGVDNLFSPKKYIIWSTYVNTHILPEYVISFRAPNCLKEFFKMSEPIKKPTSPWMPLPTLIAVLSKFLPPSDIALINKHYKDHREKKMSRHDLILKVRKIAGDELLAAIIKSFRAKEIRGVLKVAPNGGRNGREYETNPGVVNEPQLFFG